MRRSLTLAAVAATLAVPATALGASQTVQGSGDIKKMTVDNGNKAVSVALFGIGELCDKGQAAHVTIMWAKSAYVYDGICVSGQAGDGLFYHADIADIDTEVGKEISCGKLDAGVSKGAFRVKIPRSCIKKAADKIRVEARGQNFATVMPGEAGPTKRLARG